LDSDLVQRQHPKPVCRWGDDLPPRPWCVLPAAALPIVDAERGDNVVGPTDPRPDVHEPRRGRVPRLGRGQSGVAPAWTM